MDYAINSLLTQILGICDRIETAEKNNAQLRQIKSLVVGDIFAFIRHISTAGAEERIERFCEMYLDGNFPQLKKHQNTGVPQSLVLFCEIDGRLSSSNGIASLLLALFGELGKYYYSSRYDRREISKDTYVAYVRQLNDYATNQKDRTKETSDPQVMPAYQTAQDKVDATVGQTNDLQTAGIEGGQEETVDTVLAELHSLIGLSGVKAEVESLTNVIKYNNIRRERGLPTNEISKHLVFLGNPGTGKTTVARLIAKIYKQLGVISGGQCVEVDRGDLVAEHIGGTAPKTQEKINEAMGGVLFIDEAYTLAKDGKDFGQEAIDTLLKAMEDKRDRFVLIVAGYDEPMQKFLDSNPGLRSRFSQIVVFEDYTVCELMMILNKEIAKNGMILNSEAKQYLLEYLEWLVNNKPKNFANGREMRNLYELMYRNIANRMMGKGDYTNEEFVEFTTDDLPTYVKEYKHYDSQQS